MAGLCFWKSGAYGLRGRKGHASSQLPALPYLVVSLSEPMLTIMSKYKEDLPHSSESFLTERK